MIASCGTLNIDWFKVIYNTSNNTKVFLSFPCSSILQNEGLEVSYFAGGIISNVALNWPEAKAFPVKSETKEDILKVLVRLRYCNNSVSTILRTLQVYHRNNLALNFDYCSTPKAIIKKL